MMHFNFHYTDQKAGIITGFVIGLLKSIIRIINDIWYDTAFHYDIIHAIIITTLTTITGYVVVRILRTISNFFYPKK